MPDRPVRLEVPAELDRLASVRAFVRRQLATVAIGTDASADVVQAVDECVSNVIVHGYDGQDGQIEVELSVGGDTIVVRIRDDAPAFDPTAVPEPAEERPLADRLRGGMGIHLMRASMDELRYRLLPDGRNEVTMFKRIDSAE